MARPSSILGRRKTVNTVMMTLCVAAAGIGLAWLALILGALLWKGLAGLNLSVFTEMTPPPGDAAVNSRAPGSSRPARSSRPR